MIIRFNTKNGQIEVSGEYTLDELIKNLTRFYPEFNWKELTTRNNLNLCIPPLPPDKDDLPF